VIELDEVPVIKVSGFFHLDAGWFDQDAVSLATLGDIEDGVGFRRARLQALGRVSEFTNYSIEMDFATAGRPSFMDVWGEQTHLPLFGNLRIGHYRQPFSLEALTSIRELPFLERSLAFQAFVPFRRVGIMAYDHSEDEMASWAYGAYRTGGFLNAPLGDSRFATDIGDQDGWSFSGRATRLLYYDEPAEGRYLVHLGGSYNYSAITGSNGQVNSKTYEARAIPEFFVGDPAAGGATEFGTPFFVDTGRFPADSYHLFGAEAAWQAGSVWAQAEYMAVTVDQIGGPDVFFDGAYVQAGWLLTGEHRVYDRAWGVLGDVVPFTDFFGIGRHCGICGWGAWELTARWSYVNLFDPAVTPDPLAPGRPGRLHDTTLGVNWHWNRHAKVQFNWIHAFLDNAALGDSDTDIYATRFQIDF
jgi:phosphate-selective porin OprO/OprP